MKEYVKKVLDEERERSETFYQDTLEKLKSDNKLNLQKIKQAEAVVNQRKLSTLDIFLSSAKEQLNLLMEENKTFSDLNPSGTKNNESTDDV